MGHGSEGSFGVSPRPRNASTLRACTDRRACSHPFARSNLGLLRHRLEEPGQEAATTGGDRHVADKTLTCSDCGMEFAFTEREQAFYAEKGFSEPRRCPSCRASRKAARAGGDSAYSGGSYAGGYD